MSGDHGCRQPEPSEPQRLGEHDGRRPGGRAAERQPSPAGSTSERPEREAEDPARDETPRRECRQGPADRPAGRNPGDHVHREHDRCAEERDPGGHGGQGVSPDRRQQRPTSTTSWSRTTWPARRTIPTSGRQSSGATTRPSSGDSQAVKARTDEQPRTPGDIRRDKPDRLVVEVHGGGARTRSADASDRARRHSHGLVSP